MFQSSCASFLKSYIVTNSPSQLLIYTVVVIITKPINVDRIRQNEIITLLNIFSPFFEFAEEQININGRYTYMTIDLLTLYILEQESTEELEKEVKKAEKSAEEMKKDSEEVIS